MAKTSKERQQKYKKRLAALDKKSTTVFLSKEAHEFLMRERARSDKSYSETMDGALLKISKIDRILGTEHRDLESALGELRVQLDKLQNRHMEEDKEFNPRADRQIAERAPLTGAENRYRNVLEHSHNVIYRYDIKKDKFDYVSPSTQWNWKISPEEFQALSPEEVLENLIYPDDREKVSEHYLAALKEGPAGTGRAIEYRARVGEEEYRWFSHTQRVIFDKNNEPIAYVGNVSDITERKKAEEKLRILIDQLERKVKEYSDSLEEKNAALKVLLKQNQDEQAEIEQKILLNVKELIMPVVEQLKNGNPNNLQKHIDILESNLNRITSSFSIKMTSKYLNLSHQEIQVANYVMHGKATKEIAELLGLSNRTIDFHRANIRKKMGLANRRESLRTHLLSLE